MFRVYERGTGRTVATFAQVRLAELRAAQLLAAACNRLALSIGTDWLAGAEPFEWTGAGRLTSTLAVIRRRAVREDP